MKKKLKTFLLDTNVIIHTADCINMFQEHDIVIPTTVLEELSKGKKEIDEKGYNVRSFIRKLDDLRKGRQTNWKDGVSLGPGMGRLFILSSSKIHQRIREEFFEEIPDHRILSLLYKLNEETPEKDVILVSKDVDLRFKADILGLKAEDYENDKVPWNPSLGQPITIRNFPLSEIDRLYQEKEIEAEILERFLKETPNKNTLLILKNDQKSALARFVTNDNNETRIKVALKKSFCSITPRNAEQVFTMDALSDKNISLVTLLGKAGTGKTLLAMAVGLELLKEGKFEQMIVASPTIPLSNKDKGALPGDAEEKVVPYMQGIFDNLEFIKSQQNKKDQKWVEEIQKKEKERKIKIQPLFSIRGRSLNNTFFVIDEAQNLTPHEIKTITTRAGEGTKIVFSGDVLQIDDPYLDIYSNGLSYLNEKMAGERIFTAITLTKGERSYLAELAANRL
jgi:PhoH-like ATPase